MPDGGVLLIETSESVVDEAVALLNPDATPGRYVCLSVSDTGHGIAPEVLPRIFEPFFTTKEAGKGTGLGLATVFAIVKQHRGWLKVYSEPGRSTKFQIFLPASEATPEDVVRATKRPVPRGGTESILLVEDDLAVRELTRVVLGSNGYRVLEASSGVAALALWHQHRQSIALLLTDLVLPMGMSGQQLARDLQRDKPALKVLFTSGYSAGVAGAEGELRTGQNFLQKPASMDQILETVRRCLDG